MTTTPGVMLLDDGELHAVARVLDELSVAYERVAGTTASKLAPPLDLLIATPGRAEQVRRGSPVDAACGRPIRIIATDENSPGMRRKLKRLGFQILVRPTAHRDVWRLLVERATHPEIDDGTTIAITTGRASQIACVTGLANRGCLLTSNREFRAGARVAFELEGADGAPFRITGRVVRVSGEIDERDAPVHRAAIAFDDLPRATRGRLSESINASARGEAGIPNADMPSLPPCPSPDLEGLVLDDETDPLASTSIAVELEIAVETTDEGASDRRRHDRRAFTSPLVARGAGRDRVLIGRDISVGGMRVENASDLEEGDQFQLALYGPADMEPLSIRARVVRSDGRQGLALRFEDPTSDQSRRLEKLVACLPQVESLSGDDDDAISAVVSQILESD